MSLPTQSLLNIFLDMTYGMAEKLQKFIGEPETKTLKSPTICLEDLRTAESAKLQVQNLWFSLQQGLKDAKAKRILRCYVHRYPDNDCAIDGTLIEFRVDYND